MSIFLFQREAIVSSDLNVTCFGSILLLLAGLSIHCTTRIVFPYPKCLTKSRDMATVPSLVVVPVAVINGVESVCPIVELYAVTDTRRF